MDILDRIGLTLWVSTRTWLFKSKRKKNLGLPRLSSNQLEKLSSHRSGNSLFSKIFPEFQYLHGIIYGLDAVQSGYYIARDVDFSMYHAIIVDNKARGDAKLAGILTNKNPEMVIARIDSSCPVEIENFIRIWLDKDFKFD